MANILDKIFASKRDEVAAVQQKRPISDLKIRIGQQKPINSIVEGLANERTGSRIIAEIKRRTPFKGELLKDFDAQTIARTYAGHGASAISILTDTQYFGGSLDYLQDAAQEIEIPLLRKDFIFSEYQVYESRAFGADFFLLIATSLDKNQLVDLMELGRELGLTALVETHNEQDMEKAFYANARLLGINNRDLTNGKTDLGISRRLLKMTESMEDLILVCESGIHSRADIEEFEKLGMHAFLIGESLMTADNISAKLQELAGHDKTSALG